jgi:hypothetical protein
MAITWMDMKGSFRRIIEVLSGIIIEGVNKHKETFQNFTGHVWDSKLFNFGHKFYSIPSWSFFSVRCL